MANVVFFLLLIAGVVALVIHLRKRANRPEFRLRKNFKELKKSIVSSLDSGHGRSSGRGSAREEAREILNASERYLDGLIRAREQQRMLNEMMQAGSELMGVRPSEKAAERRETWGAEQLEAFFSQLSRVAAVVAIKDQDALHELRDFAEDLETQRKILSELTAGLTRSSAREDAQESLKSFEAKLRAEEEPAQGPDQESEQKRVVKQQEEIEA